MINSTSALAHEAGVTAAELGLEYTLENRSSRYYICRCEMLCKSRIIEVPPGKHDLDGADHISVNQGSSCTERSPADREMGI